MIDTAGWIAVATASVAALALALTRSGRAVLHPMALLLAACWFYFPAAYLLPATAVSGLAAYAVFREPPEEAARFRLADWVGPLVFAAAWFVLVLPRSVAALVLRSSDSRAASPSFSEAFHDIAHHWEAAAFLSVAAVWFVAAAFVRFRKRKP